MSGAGGGGGRGCDDGWGRAMQEYVDARLSPARQNRLRSLFRKLDTDQDGRLVSHILHVERIEAACLTTGVSPVAAPDDVEFAVAWICFERGEARAQRRDVRDKPNST